ncbi:hypothetical protein DPMN_189252 [Dreissena polymorpha]|uniref:Uncharacterized protein n=1 Tax=Dreissena polymorpha TaxID=45954 RepID=A0A9D4DU05_DREPO|nr:hypothetical protein DPMN_189252 [Dreissena polymorpha]
MEKIWAERHKPGRWCDGEAKNSIFTEKVIGVLTTTIRNSRNTIFGRRKDASPV